MFYNFTDDELPFPKRTALRYLCKATVMRRQYQPDEHVRFSDDTQIRLVVPTDQQIEPFITATCPETGSCLRLRVEMRSERTLANRNDAIAYLRRALCVEAIAVSERDMSNIKRHGVRRHYTREFFSDLIEKYRFRVENFHTHNYYQTPVYD